MTAIHVCDRSLYPKSNQYQRIWGLLSSDRIATVIAQIHHLCRSRQSFLEEETLHIFSFCPPMYVFSCYLSQYSYIQSLDAIGILSNICLDTPNCIGFTSNGWNFFQFVYILTVNRVPSVVYRATLKLGQYNWWCYDVCPGLRLLLRPTRCMLLSFSSLFSSH